MKALVLSAGFGTRLRPHTLELPKPLFPISGRPIIDIIIKQLIGAGATGIAVNTHYMADKIESFLEGQVYSGADIRVRREPDLLGTGGAVGNFSDFFQDAPFVVINSDVLTSIDLRRLYEAHLSHNFPVTLAMHDYPMFNKVQVDPGGFIEDFSGQECPGRKLLAFTGISVIDPSIYGFIEPGRPCCILDIYRRMIRNGEKIFSHMVSGHYWNDLGTPERYRDAVADYMAPCVFENVYHQTFSNHFDRQILAGDGSDRKWFRVSAGGCTMVLADHGIHTGENTAQVDAFVAIGRHLRKVNIPVPEIYAVDRFSGLVFTQDLGDTMLQEVVSGHGETPSGDETLAHYRNIIEILVKMSVYGKKGFNPAWTYEGASYDRELIIERECRYFTNRFLTRYLNFTEISETGLLTMFNALAGSILENGYIGLMHRDFQSRNIMVNDGRYYFIDFQGARLGPVQYDLASLLVDPYVNMDPDLQEALLDHALDTMDKMLTIEKHRFLTGYRYCCISRLMQALGAYAFLSREKGKTWFEQYIPAALDSLKRHLEALPVTCNDYRLSELAEIVSSAKGRFDPAKLQPNPKI